MFALSKPEIVFRGVKVFPKQDHKKVEIIIVNHQDLHCFEVITFGLRPYQEDVRVYLDSDIMVKKINLHQFYTTFDVKERAARRLNKPFVPGYERKIIAQNMISSSLQKRLQIVPTAFCGEFNLNFESSSFNDMQRKLFQLDVEMESKPDGLEPFDCFPSPQTPKK